MPDNQGKLSEEDNAKVLKWLEENLASSDAMIARTRRRMIRAAIALREGSPAPAVDKPELYRQRSGGVILAKGADWIESTKKLREAFVRHTELVGD